MFTSHQKGEGSEKWTPGGGLSQCRCWGGGLSDLIPTVHWEALWKTSIALIWINLGSELATVL